MRLDPRLKYLAELAARKQRRTLSGYIEWAVERSFSNVLMDEDYPEPTTVESAERTLRLWDVDEAERVSKLALHYPDLLTYEEQVIWRLVKDCGHLWRGQFTGNDRRWTWATDATSLLVDRLRKHWPTFKKVAAREWPEEKLPGWQEFDTKPNDDIPF